MDHRRRTARLPGVQVAVRVGGELVLSEAFGTASLSSQRPLTPEHVFRVASHSKTFTATVVLQLAAEGALRLDDRVATHVPSAPDGEGRLGRSTLRQVLAHASGAWRDGAAAPHWSLDAPFPSDEAAVEAMVAADPAAVFAPGERFKYSNVGYTVLGQVVERVTGRAYADVVHERVVAPLGLRSTFPDLAQALASAAPMAAGHSSARRGQRRRVLPDVSTGRMAAATGFCSTAADLTRYLTAHRIGSGELLDDGWKREQQLGLFDVQGAAPGTRYALGFAVERVCGRTTIGHGGGFPGFITYSLADPAPDGDGLAVSVLTNAIDGPAAPLASGTFKLFAEAASSAAAADDGAASCAHLDRYTGCFHSPWGSLVVARLGARLVAFDADLVDPLSLVSELEEVEDGVLRIVDGGGYGSRGERVTYDFLPDGAAARVEVGAHTHLPWDAYVGWYGVEVDEA